MNLFKSSGKNDIPPSVEPFEICSIRPPTENQSLTFRLTRNCYWNRCGFCPVYKFGAKFSKRTLSDIQKDIANAKKLYKIMDDAGIGNDLFGSLSLQSDHQKASELIGRLNSLRPATDSDDCTRHQESLSEIDDPVLAWFLKWVKNTFSIEDCVYHLLAWRQSGSKNCFLGDADSLILKPEFLETVILDIKKSFPSIQRFTIYGRTSTAARNRTVSDLKRYKRSGLNRVHFGLESGSDEVLQFIHKGLTRKDHLEGCLKTKESGLSCSVYVMPGLGGQKMSDVHAHETASLISLISPDYVRLRTLQVFPQTPIARAMAAGDFIEADEMQVVKEIRILISEIDTQTMIISDSATNLLAINGELPKDRGRMLKVIDEYLNLSPREKLHFSLESRLNSFEGQYGGISEDIYAKIIPFIKNGTLDLTLIDNDATSALIRLIRSKLMP